MHFVVKRIITLKQPLRYLEFQDFTQTPKANFCTFQEIQFLEMRIPDNRCRNLNGV